LDKVYRRKAIMKNCDGFWELSTSHALVLVKAHDPAFCDIVFEFARVSGSKWRCFGVARSSYFADKLAKIGIVL
jgi:hypothetical protein